MEDMEITPEESKDGHTSKGKKKSKKKNTKEKNGVEKQVYLPDKPLAQNEELVCDQSAYVMLRQVQTGAPCLSFDVIRDELGSDRTEFPLTCYTVAGTQASSAKENCILVMKMSNLHKTQENEDDEDEDDDDDDDDDDEEEPEERRPRLDYASIHNYGCINRIRSTTANNTILAASWTEMGRVDIWDLKTQIQAVNDMRLLAKYRESGVSHKPVFTFSGHQSEGFAVDWCSTAPGVLATGDCKKNIHLWQPHESDWKVDQRPLLGHSASVEDLQWSPNERNVLCSASVDKSIRIWDTRASAAKACMITVEEAHESDVNVINWNKNAPLIVSGGDDGFIHIWDLRQLQSGKSVATFKHHTAPVTTVEWHPKEATVLASGGEDNQVALWDLGVEKDTEAVGEDVDGVPPQLLFIHQGQKDIKELHWHPDLTGVLLSTALNGFNIFRTISV